MQNSQVLHRPKGGGKPRVPPMQKIDACGMLAQWPVSWGAAPKAEGPLSTNPGHSASSPNTDICRNRRHRHSSTNPANLSNHRARPDQFEGNLVRRALFGDPYPHSERARARAFNRHAVEKPSILFYRHQREDYGLARPIFPARHVRAEVTNPIGQRSPERDVIHEFGKRYAALAVGHREMARDPASQRRGVGFRHVGAHSRADPAASQPGQLID